MENLYLPYTLILVGLLLMAGELVLMTHGLLFVLGLAGVVAGISMTFATSAAHGLATLLAVFVLVPTVGPLLLGWWRRTAIGRRMVLEQADEDATVANMPVNLELESLRGRFGKTVSTLRPSGITEFDGRRIDTLSEGEMIEPGQWVRCIDVKAGKVVVRAVEKPPALEDLDPQHLQ